MPSLLSIKNLCTCFRTEQGELEAVRDVSLEICRGSTVAIVGESGSGKSMTAFSVMRLVPAPGFIRSGSILFEGINMLQLPEEELRSIRGRRISMVFQEPMTSLNPVFRIGDQVAEPLILHERLSRTDAMEKSIELLKSVGIPSPAERLRDYPHQLSGGMRQRVMIAMALACNPALLIADEPTTALDVTIQAQILELIDELKQSSQLGIMLITHDLGIVAERSDFTSVMYAGSIVESATSTQLLANPLHPYTKALISSLPQFAEPGTPLATLPGQPPSLNELITGCGFCNRCPEVMPVCREQVPELSEITPGHYVRCWKTR